jgi:hypothetical protein
MLARPAQSGSGLFGLTFAPQVPDFNECRGQRLPAGEIASAACVRHRSVDALTTRPQCAKPQTVHGVPSAIVRDGDLPGMPQEPDSSDPQANLAEIANQPPFRMGHQRITNAWGCSDNQVNTTDRPANCDEQRRQRAIATPKRYASDRQKHERPSQKS